MAWTAETVAGLTALVEGRHTGDGTVTVTDVTHDSRQVGPGSLFIALRGGSFDGHHFVPTAVSAGAAAVCVESESEAAIPQIVVENTRAVAGPMAARVHGDPSRHLSVIGVTGTNGKTTITHYIDSMASAVGRTTGLVGTIQTKIAGERVPSTLTTPEASDFQRLLATMLGRGVDLVSAEVSSHALELDRVKATRFDVAAFSNLSQDHLDFHGDMESYRAAKSRLFREYEVGTAVLNIDDAVGESLAAGFDGDAVTVGQHGDVRIEWTESSGGVTHVDLTTPWGAVSAPVNVIGEFNLANLALATACCLAVGIEFEAVAEAMPHVEGVDGRYQVVSGADPITVVVDYAHTPEAVTRAIEAARDLTRGRVIALLGAGGDRDRRKRPAMGAALSVADVSIVTSDNPRSEEPAQIVGQVVAGVLGEHIVEVDRRVAIERAIDAAEDGDIVLILGRGHEPFQQVGGDRVPFDDRKVAAETLRRRRSAETGSTSGSMSP